MVIAWFNDARIVLIEKKFYKAAFDEVMKDPIYKPFIDKVIDEAYSIKAGDKAAEGEGESPDTDEDEVAA